MNILLHFDMVEYNAAVGIRERSICDFVLFCISSKEILIYRKLFPGVAQFHSSLLTWLNGKVMKSINRIWSISKQGTNWLLIMRFCLCFFVVLFLLMTRLCSLVRYNFVTRQQIVWTNVSNFRCLFSFVNTEKIINYQIWY